MKNTVEEIAKNFNITKKLAKDVVDAVVASMRASLLDGELRITGLGTLKVKEKPARNGRNPKTGEKLVIAAHKAVKFNISKNLKEAIQ